MTRSLPLRSPSEIEVSIADISLNIGWKHNCKPVDEKGLDGSWSLSLQKAALRSVMIMTSHPSQSGLQSSPTTWSGNKW